MRCPVLPGKAASRSTASWPDGRSTYPSSSDKDSEAATADVVSSVTAEVLVGSLDASDTTPGSSRFSNEMVRSSTPGFFPSGL